jgi:peptidyl-prolyl cis-trans isomerase C
MHIPACQGTPKTAWLFSAKKRMHLDSSFKEQDMFARTILIAALLLSTAMPALAANDAAVVARVGKDTITEMDVRLAMKELGEALPAEALAERREQVINYLIDIRLASRVAEEKKLQNTADFARHLELSRQRLLMDALLSEVSSKVTEAEIKKFYDERAKAVSSDEEVRARHILVATEDEAKKVVERLKKGEDFAKLATELSKDPGSKDGGDLGYFSKDRMVPEFADAAFKLNKGEISAPVKSPFGWHVIKQEDRRKREAPEFKTVEKQIGELLKRKAQDDFVTALRTKEKIEIVGTGASKVAPAADTNQPAKK